MKAHTTLIATLGGQPQVVTFMLDLLLAREIPVDQVVIVYLDGDKRSQQAFRLLAGEFGGGQYRGRACHLRAMPVRIGERMLDDAFEPAQIEAIRAAFDSLLYELKQHNHNVHLGLSGGRRVMALVGLSATSRYLSPTDKVWHIYTPDDLIARAHDGALLHAEPEDDVRLIEVPFVPWVSLFPGLAPLLEHKTMPIRFWLDPEETRRCGLVWNSITNRQRDYLRQMANGLSRQEIAAQLNVAPATVDTQRDKIIECCMEVWEAKRAFFNARFFLEKFGAYLSNLA